MISFNDFHAVDGQPIYLQMILHIKRGLAAGTIRQGEELPSRRLLSATLAVNPNTVQKAYHLLEEEGIITSRPGAASYICVTKEQIEIIKKELYEEEIRKVVLSMKAAGLSLKEAKNLIEKIYGEEEQ